MLWFTLRRFNTVHANLAELGSDDAVRAGQVDVSVTRQGDTR